MEDRAAVVTLIDEAVDAGAGFCRACKVAGIDRRTYRRWLDRETGEVRVDARPETPRERPSQALRPEEREQILLTCQLPHFVDMPPSQIVPTLADQGVYLGSESSFYRILHAAEQQHERGRARRRSTSTVTSHRATGPNQVWCWDVTYLATMVRGLHYYLYMLMDVWSRKIVAWEVYDCETGELASELVSRAVLAERCSNVGLVLHADNGSPQKSSTLRATLQRLGIQPSFSRPRVSDDNPYIESLFRTTKYRHDYPVDGFADIDAARTWVLGFVKWYNTEHQHSAIRFVSPADRHTGQDKKILTNRERVYEQAKQANPSRWSGNTRNWKRPEVVWLNPDRPIAEEPEIIKNAA